MSASRNFNQSVQRMYQRSAALQSFVQSLREDNAQFQANRLEYYEKQEKQKHRRRELLNLLLAERLEKNLQNESQF